ncbi:MAG: hypothetical protein U0353_09190 [Sandaracinus sp.]
MTRGRGAQVWVGDARHAAFVLGVVAVLGIGCGARDRPHAARQATPRSLVARPRGVPVASIDLGDDAAASLVEARWRWLDVTIEEVAGVELGPDARPTPSATARTHAIHPRPRDERWEEAPWQPFAPHELETRRGAGQLSMGWARLSLRIPERIGERSLEGTTLALSLTVDDYAEVWVDGRLRPRLGQAGRGVIGGWNAPSRVILTGDAQPGTSLEVAILAINGPLSRSPENFLFVREAVLDVYAPADEREGTTIERTEARAGLDEILAVDARLEIVATGFGHIASLAWSDEEQSLLVADAGRNELLRFAPDDGTLELVRAHAGDAQLDGHREGGGPSGLSFDDEGRLLVCEPGRGRVTRTERTLALTELVAPALGLLPDDAVRLASGATWIVARERDGVGLVELAAEGERVVRLAPSARVRSVSADATRVLATMDAPPRVMSFALEGPSPIELVREEASDVPLGELVIDARGHLFVAGARGVVVHDRHGARLGIVRTPGPVDALSLGEPGALYAGMGTELVRLEVVR